MSIKNLELNQGIEQERQVTLEETSSQDLVGVKEVSILNTTPVVDNLEQNEEIEDDLANLSNYQDPYEEFIFNGKKYHIPMPATPFINLSTGKLTQQRRERIQQLLFQPMKLSNFEVDLYTSYPDLIPRKRNLRPNTVPYFVALHKLGFEFVFFDTETTGMEKNNPTNIAQGHRIISLGLVSFKNGVLLDDPKHVIEWRFNPDMEIDFEASRVHGITNKDLEDCPRFHEYIPELIKKIRGRVLIAHNADFDTTFINQELALAGCKFKLEDICLIGDSLKLARSFITGHTSLQALQQRFQINIERKFHGAALDSIILGHVYQAMMKSKKVEILDDLDEQGSVNFEDPLVIPKLVNIDLDALKKQANALVLTSDAKGQENIQALITFAKNRVDVDEILDNLDEEDYDEDEYLDEEII